MCCLRVCKGKFPLRIRRKTPRPPCFRRPFGAGSCSGICRAICAKRDGVFGLREGQRCLSTYRRRGMEFFGCRRGEGVSLPTAVGDGVFWLQEGRACLSTYHEGDGSFWVAGRARVSLYLPPRGMGVFWLQAGRGCLSTYPRGGWSFLVAGRAKVSLYLPPQEQGAEKRPPRRRDGRWWAIAGV